MEMFLSFAFPYFFILKLPLDAPSSTLNQLNRCLEPYTCSFSWWALSTFLKFCMFSENDKNLLEKWKTSRQGNFNCVTHYDCSMYALLPFSDMNFGLFPFKILCTWEILILFKNSGKVHQVTLTHMWSVDIWRYSDVLILIFPIHRVEIADFWKFRELATCAMRSEMMDMSSSVHHNSNDIQYPHITPSWTSWTSANSPRT